jgi:soluble lytic murein transglycosylase
MKRNIIIFLMILTVLTGAYVLSGQNSCLNAPDLNRGFYKQALKLENQNEYKEAYYAYKKVSPFYSAYDGVLYHQAECAAQIEDEKTAIKKLETLILKYPQSKLLPAAYYKLGQAYIRTHQDKKAEKTFKKIVHKYPKSDYKIAAYYYLGIVNTKTNPSSAIWFWKKYLELSPSGRFGLDCINNLKNIKANFSNFDRTNIAITYYYAGKYQSAINNFEMMPINKSWYYLAKCYKETNQKDKAIATIRKGLIYYSNCIPKDNLIEMVKLYSILDPKPKLQTWSELETLTQHTKAHDYALYNLAKASPKIRANYLYQQAIKENTDSDYSSEAMWELMWNAYESHNYRLAMQIANKHRQMYKHVNSTPKVLFWMGKTYEKQGKKRQAIGCYKKILSDYNTSYYAFRADGRIKGIKTGRDPKWSVKSNNRINNSIFNLKNPYPSYRMFTKYGESFMELLEIEDYGLISLYKIDDGALSSWINYEKGMAPKSCLDARNVLEQEYPMPKINADICKLAFPLHFVDEINSAAKRNKIDSAIIISIVREESYFNPKIRSSADAVGLMQMLPSTAAHICKKKGLENGNLRNPKTNIRLGTAYLKYLHEITGNMLYTVASYNAGPGAVMKWAKYQNSADLDEFVENIPYPETQNYIRKVYRSYWCYKRLY